MIKILIVDDELPIREWMEFVLSKIEIPIQVIGSASNGKEALSLFHEYAPHLIFTDIKMPIMDGIELLKQIKTESPTTAVAMLTSHNDFDYAKDSLNYDANFFILKSEISLEILTEIIMKCYTFLHKEQHSAFLQNTFLETDFESIDNWLRVNHVEKPKPPYFIISLFCESSLDYVTQATKSICTANSAFLTGFYEYRNKQKVFFISLATTPASQLYQFNMYHTITSEICDTLHVSLGSSSLIYTGQALTEALLNSILSLNLLFYEPGSVKVFTTSEKSSLAAKEFFRQECQSIILNISEKNYKNVFQNIESLFRSLDKERIPHIQFIKSLFTDIITNYKMVALGCKIPQAEALCSETITALDQITSYEKMQTTLLHFLSHTSIHYLSEYTIYSEYVKSALIEISNHYDTIEKISDISAYLNLNYEYFCRLFKNEVGISPNRYLTEYRLNIAEELLRSTNMKVCEIANQVGYHNLSYFAKLFKQKNGKNPFDFRH